MFGFVEWFITAKVLETTRAHRLGSQIALEALIGSVADVDGIIAETKC